MEYDRNENEHIPCTWQGASCELGNVAHLQFVGCKIIHFQQGLVDTFLNNSVKAGNLRMYGSKLDMIAILDFCSDLTFVKIGHGRKCHVLPRAV